MSPLTTTLLLLLATAAMASATREWVKYKLQHEKLYSEEEDTARMKIWMKNVAMVEKHNSEKHNYTMAINKFSDWTEEEFNNFIGYRTKGERSNGKTFENVKTPNRVDFRQEDLVTPVKDQRNCDSSWAFSATGAIEGVWAKNNGQLVPLSTQQLVDCVIEDWGCGGGLEIQAWNPVVGGLEGQAWNPVVGGLEGQAWTHVIQVGGIQSEESYPYTAHDGSCNEDSSKFVAQISGYQEINSDEHQIESALVELGHPISIGVHADDTWTHYDGGIYDKNEEWNGPVNHAVLLVGYDKSGPQPFWIVKNCYGTEWGENGYIRIKMGVNICGLKNFACYPTTAKASTTTISASTSTTTASTSAISTSTSTTTANITATTRTTTTTPNKITP